MSQKGGEWTIHFLNKKALIRVRWLLPVLYPPIHDAGILVEKGIIAKVDSFKSLKKHNTYPIEDLGECILIPSLTNPHLHLELSVIKCRLPQSKGFVT